MRALLKLKRPITELEVDLEENTLDILEPKNKLNWVETLELDNGPPTVNKDIVEVIRCKDCLYMTEHYDTDGNTPYWTCSEWDSGTDYDGFCHYGERKDGLK